MMMHIASSTVASGSTDEQLQPQTAVDAAVRMIDSLTRRITGRSSLSTGGPSQDEKSRPLPHSAPQAETLQRASSIGSKRQRSNEETACPSPCQHKKARCESRLIDEVEDDADDERHNEDEDDNEDQDEGEDEYEGKDDEDDSNFGDKDEDEDKDEAEAENFNNDSKVKVGTLPSSPLFDYYNIDDVDYPMAMVHLRDEEPESMDDEDQKIWLVLGDEDDVDIEVGSESEWEDAPRDIWQGIGQHKCDTEVAQIQATVHFSRDELTQDGEDKMAKLLRKAECTVNLTYRVLICHKCGYALDPTALNGHFNSKHNGKLSKKNKTSTPVPARSLLRPLPARLLVTRLLRPPAVRLPPPALAPPLPLLSVPTSTTAPVALPTRTAAARKMGGRGVVKGRQPPVSGRLVASTSGGRIKAGSRRPSLSFTTLTNSTTARLWQPTTVTHRRSRTPAASDHPTPQPAWPQVPLPEDAQPTPPDWSAAHRLGSAVSSMFGGLARHLSQGTPAVSPGDNDAPGKRKWPSSSMVSSTVHGESEHPRRGPKTRRVVCPSSGAEHSPATPSSSAPSLPAFVSNDSDGNLYADEDVHADSEGKVHGDPDNGYLSHASGGNTDIAMDDPCKDPSKDCDHQDPTPSDVETTAASDIEESVLSGDDDLLEGSDAEPENTLRSSDISPLLPPLDQELEVKRLKATIHRGAHHWQPKDRDTQRVMSKAKFVVDMQYKILICTICRYALDPERIHGHFNSEHRRLLSVSDMDRLTAICLSFELCGPDIMKRVRPRNRKIHYGLTIYPSIVFCASCHRSFESEGSFARWHSCPLKQNPVVPDAKRYYRAKAQTFFKNRKDRRFSPVDQHSLNPIANSAEAKQAWDRVKPMLVEPAFEQVPIKSPKNLCQLSVFERREGWSPYVKGKTGQQLQEIVDEPRDPPVVDLLSLYVERYVDVALYALKDESYTIQSKLVNIGLRDEYKGSFYHTKTWLEYVHKFLPALCFVIRAARDDLPEHFKMDLTDDQWSSALELFRQLEIANEAGGQPVSMEQLEEDRQQKIFMDRFGTDRPVLEPFHRLLWSLLSHKKVGCDPNKFYTPLYNFLVLSSYNAQGRLKFAASISHFIAPLLYICRLSIFTQGVLYSQEKDAPYLEIFPCIKPCLDLESSMPLALVLSTNQIVSSIRLNEEGIPWIQFADKEYKTWLHHGKVEILCGISDDDEAFDFKRTRLVNSPQNSVLHYSFIQHPENDFKKYCHALLHVWIGNESTHKCFVNDKAQDSESIWHLDEIKRVYAHYNRLQHIFLAITWFACGPPGHATEWQALIGTNSQQGHMRSLYVFTDELYLVTGYHKNIGATGKQKVIVQPAMEYLVKMTHGSEARMRMYDDVFPLAGQAQRSDTVNTTFAGLMCQYLGIELNVHDTRAATAAVEAFALNVSAETRERHTHKFHRLRAQMRGHTPEVDDRCPYKLRENTYHSQLHQVALGFCPHPDAQDMVALVASGHAQVVVNVEPSFESQKQIAQLVLDGVASALNESFVQTVSSILSRIPRVSEAQHDAQEKDRVVALALKCLREMLNEETTLFRILEQGVAVTKALTGHDLLAVLPTNAGKSFILLAVSYYYRSLSKFVVVVIPISILVEEWKNKCRGIGLKFSVWTLENQNPEAPIVFISPENATIRDFYSWAKDKAAASSLITLVFDEFHLIVEHQSFRNCFWNLASLGRFSLQLILLTAMVPTRIIPALLNATGSRDAQTIRAPITRPELKYHYRYFNSKQKALEFTTCEYRRSREQYNTEDRAIVFAQSIGQCEDVSARLCCPVYSGKLPVDHQAEVYHQWSQVGPVVAATLALRYGVNVPHVRDIFFFGLPGNFLLAEQEAGQAGRDNRPACVWFIEVDNASFFRHPPAAHNLLGDADIVTALCTVDCLRLPFSQFFNDCNVSCPELPHVQLCMNCKKSILGPLPTLFPRDNPTWGEPVISPYLPEMNKVPAGRGMGYPGLCKTDGVARIVRATIFTRSSSSTHSHPHSSHPIHRASSRNSSRTSYPHTSFPPSTKHGNGRTIQPKSDSSYGMFDGDDDLYMAIDIEALPQPAPNSGLGHTYITIGNPSPIDSSLARQIFSDLPDASSSAPSSPPRPADRRRRPLPLPPTSTPMLSHVQQQDDVFSDSSLNAGRSSAAYPPVALWSLPFPVSSSPTRHALICSSSGTSSPIAGPDMLWNDPRSSLSSYLPTLLDIIELSSSPVPVPTPLEIIELSSSPVPVHSPAGPPCAAPPVPVHRPAGPPRAALPVPVHRPAGPPRAAPPVNQVTCPQSIGTASIGTVHQVFPWHTRRVN
ncbi:hypothetical protein PUNSTDRAFT_135056 [Punctularia strigosozonata HHB-11173 SS5]|uniref:uncharacterized protein n=1 Tax=Punctularia strigosozonata (strain HHB-11173) TaxID=741275 RepID=UPI0004418008|nr:uncharacterized protein PUNSTDRAFT_135056 [Punctularia strigosozonata HHB-11173 SS5]EIN08677.1 hypothetical protein PUNSTDRAFT_135056 [Punctularia strigosozonata HHB-11173 SS5]